MKERRSFILIVAMLVSLTGCALSQEQPPAEEEYSYEQFLLREENGQPDIYLITKGYDNFYWDTLRQGARTAAENYGCNLYVGGTPSEAHLEILAKLVQDAVEADADAIILSPADVPQTAEAVDQIREAGIPLIFVDTILNGKEFDVCYATDNMQAGRLAAKEMLKLLYQNGREDAQPLTVGIDIGMAESQTILERLAGFQEYWSSYAPKSWKVIEDIKINSGDIDLAQKQGDEFMDSSRDLAGLVGLNNGSTVGLARSVAQRTRTDLVLVGFDYSEEMEQLITGGEYQAASIVQRQSDMGYKGVEQAFQLIKGGAVEFRYVDTGVQQVDHENVNSLYIQEIIGGESD